MKENDFNTLSNILLELGDLADTLEEIGDHGKYYTGAVIRTLSRSLNGIFDKLEDVLGENHEDLQAETENDKMSVRS